MKISTLVGGCSSFFDSSTYVDILLGRNNYLCYILNQLGPSSSNAFRTPLQALTNVVVAPTIPNLPPHILGCVAFVHLHKN